MIETLLVIVVVWLSLTAPREVVDQVVLVSGAPSLAQCELTRREVLHPWSDPSTGLFVWSWCVEVGGLE